MIEFKVNYKEVNGTQIFETMTWADTIEEARKDAELDLVDYEIVNVEEN